jgi:hypothetical protein
MKRILTALLLAAAMAGAAAPSPGVEAAATGGGHYFLPPFDLEMQFGFSAILHGNGRATGSFHHRGVLEGLDIDFKGRVTCLSVDPVNHRAWIGGVVTANRSTHPGFTTSIHEVGDDIWFRVVDYGPGQSDAILDRTTIVGFESAAIPTSQFYCDTLPWPDDDARTWEVTGNVTVRP